MQQAVIRPHLVPLVHEPPKNYDSSTPGDCTCRTLVLVVSLAEALVLL